MFDSPNNNEIDEIVTKIEKICKKHNCWIDYKESNLADRNICIDGKSILDIIDCAEELENSLE